MTSPDSLTLKVHKVSLKGRLTLAVARPYELEYYFELIQVHPRSGMPIDTQVGLLREQRGQNNDKFIYGYADTVNEAIDLYNQFCAANGVKPSKDTEDYLRQRVDQRAQDLCLLIIERVINIG